MTGDFIIKKQKNHPEDSSLPLRMTIKRSISVNKKGSRSVIKSL